MVVALVAGVVVATVALAVVAAGAVAAALVVALAALVAVALVAVDTSGHTLKSIRVAVGPLALDCAQQV